MLSLSLDIARSGLTASGEQAAVLSRNIANAGNPLASRKIANVISIPGGGAMVSTITRVSNDALTRSLQAAISGAAGQEELTSALDRLQATINDPNLETSPTALIAKLRESLQVHASSPNNPSAAYSVIDRAKQLTLSLNEATATIRTVREQADTDMVTSVGRVNELLGKFETLNNQIIHGTRDGLDVTDQLDARDDVLRSLSEEIGIRTVTHNDMDMIIYTESGLTLFDTQPRTVSMAPSTVLAPGTSGNAVYVDGVPVTGSGAMMEIETGRLAALASVRDDYAPNYQRQMDEIARGLIEAFAETDQSTIPVQPDIPGLFTYSGAPTMPPTGIVMDGLAGAISVNANVDPAQGGDYRLLRDGSIGSPGDPVYTYNTTGAAGFTDRIQGMIDALGSPRAFDPASGLGSPLSLTSAASSSSGWLEEARQRTSADSDYRQALMERTRDALSRATGVNLDEEMTSLLDVERAYQTSTKLLTVIDDMFRALLNAA